MARKLASSVRLNLENYAPPYGGFTGERVKYGAAKVLFGSVGDIN